MKPIKRNLLILTAITSMTYFYWIEKISIPLSRPKSFLDSMSGIYLGKSVTKNTTEEEITTEKVRDGTTEKVEGNPSTIVAREGTCKCKKSKWPRTYLAEEFLNQYHPWYNISEEESVKRHHPNLPIKTFRSFIAEDGCNLMPSLFSIDWINTYWQEAPMKPNSSFHLYSAIYDNRSHAEGPCLRILTTTEEKEPTHPYCYLWFNTTGPAVFSRVARIDFLDWQSRSASRMVPFILTCPIPSSVKHLVPEAMSLVGKPCDQAKNMLKVIGLGNRNKTTAFVKRNERLDKDKTNDWAVAVCSTGLHYFHEDASLRLVEWLEIMKALGVSEVIFHLTDVHPNILSVLAHYEQEGFISVIDFTYPGPYVNERGLRKWWVSVQRSHMWSMENIYFTDCLLRNMHKYRFIAHHDPDEVPIFKNQDDYPAAVNYLLKTNKKGMQPTHYKIKWNLHHINQNPTERASSLPSFLWFLRHNARSKVNVPGSPGKFKSIFDMDYVYGVMSHHPLKCISGGCRQRILPTEEMYLAHFRGNCSEECLSAGVAEETTLLKFSSQIKENVSKVVKKFRLKEN